MKKLLLVPVLALALVGVAQAVPHTGSVKATEVEFHIKLSAASESAARSPSWSRTPATSPTNSSS